MPTELSIALLCSTVVTAMLAGLCWTVQLVVYPQFANVPAASFEKYHADHARRITWIVGPLMVGELALGLWILWVPGVDRTLAWALFLLIVVVWASTAALQVPLHMRLERDGFAEEPIRRLVRSNWVRTLAWTARAAVLAWLIGAQL